MDCGGAIPKGRRAWTCSDYCAHEHRRKKEAALKEERVSEVSKPGRGRPRRADDAPGTRPCAGGCGRVIVDYRCKACWAKLRSSSGDGHGYEEYDV